jgi:hypothetical protein
MYVIDARRSSNQSNNAMKLPRKEEVWEGAG